VCVVDLHGKMCFVGEKYKKYLAGTGNGWNLCGG